MGITTKNVFRPASLFPEFGHQPRWAPYAAFGNYDQDSVLNMLRWDSSAVEWRDVGGSSLASASGRAVALAFGPKEEPWNAFLEKDGRLSVMRLSE